MTIRELMQENGENLSWCRPYVSDDGAYAISVTEGEVSGMRLNGDDSVSASLAEPGRRSELLKQFAKAVNPDYGDYDGWDDLHIALEGKIRERGCAECPWFDVCDAVSGDVEEG